MGKIVRKVARLLVLSGLLLPVLPVAASQVNSTESLSDMPKGWGQVVVQTQEGCPEISGQYSLTGQVVPEAPSYIRTLNYVLQAAMPSVTYQPNVEKFAILEAIQDQQVKVTIMLGAAARSTFKEVSCERGWLRLEKKGEGGAEGNTVGFHTVTLLNKNQDGDLVVQYFEGTKSSTLFGLLRSKSVNHYWLLFSRYKTNEKPK